MTSPMPANPDAYASVRPNKFTPHQKYIQQILAITFASVSILAALVTIYWFIRMKKVFRHHLIMLLVASDLFKAIWYFIPALVILVEDRPIPLNLCEAAGFLSSIGVEASDFIILLIALHTALSVLRPGKSRGLHYYRYAAYACWVTFFVTLPAIAFVNPIKGQAYISQGTYCFLPVRPIWYRLVLSWIPRYLILSIIVSIYLAIYSYTVTQFGKFDTKTTSSTLSSVLEESHGTYTTAVPPRDTLRRWLFKCFKKRSRSRTKDHLPAQNNDDPAHMMSGGRGSSLQADRSAVRSARKPTVLGTLRDKCLFPYRDRQIPNDTNPTLRKRHKAIKRQLRYMFIYPLVYLLMWIAPFINHCFFYTKAHNPNFVLNSIGLVSLCLQCAVDCLIFSIRERPWRYGNKDSRVSSDRQSSVGAGSEIGMVDFASRNRESNKSPAMPDASGNRGSTEQAGRQPAGKNWFDNEAL